METSPQQSTFNFAPLLALPVLLPLVLLQSALFSYVRVAGVTVQVAVVVVLAVALWRSSAETIIWAVIAGLLIDLGSIAPIGSSALALTFAVLAIAPFRANLNYNRVILPFLLGIVAMIVYELSYMLLLRMVGTATNSAWVAQLPTRVLVHSVLALPLYWLLRATGAVNRRTPQINL